MVHIYVQERDHRLSARHGGSATERGMKSDGKHAAEDEHRRSKGDGVERDGEGEGGRGGPLVRA